MKCTGILLRVYSRITMKKRRHFFRKAIIFCLVACMFIGMIPAAFANAVSDAEAAYYYELSVLKQLREQACNEAEIAAQQAKVDAAYAKYVGAQEQEQAEQYAAWEAQQAEQERLAQEALAAQYAAWQAEQARLALEAEQANMNAEQLPEQTNLMIMEQLPEQQNVLNVEQLPEQQNVLNVEQVPEQQTVLNAEQIPAQQNVLNVEQIPAQQNVLNVEQVPAQQTVLNVEQIPAQSIELKQLPEQMPEESIKQLPEQMPEESSEQFPEQTTENSEETVNGENELPVEAKFASQKSLPQVFDGLAKLWKSGGQLFASLVEALDATGNGGTIRLTGNVADGDALMVTTNKENITIDFDGHSYTVNNGNGSAASFTGNGSVTVSNGTLSGTGIGETVTSNMEHLTFRDMLIQGIHSIGAVIGVYGGETDLVGRTTVDAGDKDDLAITVYDRDGNVDLRVNTTGIINGGVQVTNIDQPAAQPEFTANAWLHNGFYSGDVDYDGKMTMNSKIMVDGGEYLDDVYEYVPFQTNYADVSNAYGTIHSAGANIPWTALRSRWNAPTFVNIRKSGGAVCLPWGVLAKNSTDKVISLNGSLLGRGGVELVGAWCCCAKHEIVEGGNSEWFKGTEDGLVVELDADISYVTVDGKKAEAKIDGVEAEFEAELLEELSVGKHLVRFVLTDGCSVDTTLRISRDEELEWIKGSQNGLMFEFEKDVKKVLVNNVKVASVIEKNNVLIGADVFEDLKPGRQTIEFVLKDMSHVVTSVTIIK